MPEYPDIPDLTLIKKIGTGSYGDVWLARTVTGVYRAVKVVERARFREERPYQRELEGITHFQRLAANRPRQLALMHVGVNEAEGFFYYIMELADDVHTGTDIDPANYEPLTLKALLRHQRTIPADECVRIGADLARSLAELHNSGLIHRDVKLSNVIFVAGVPKLADIGLVSATDFTRTALGTPGYAPPEGTGTVSADLYGLGKILYEMATGFEPGAFPRLPGDIGSRTDRAGLMELNEIILKACSPNPSQRYTKAEAMLDDLLLLQAGRSIRELQRTRERLRLARRVALVAIIISLVGAGILGIQNHMNLRRLAAAEAEARRKAESDERIARYRADLHRALLSLLEQDTGLTRATLRRQIPPAGEAKDIRGLEWYALWNEAEGDETRVLGKPGDPPLRGMMLSPDRRYLAVRAGIPGRPVSLWDLHSGRRRPIATVSRGIGGFSLDGRRLIVGHPDESSIVEYDLETGETAPPRSVEGSLIPKGRFGEILLTTSIDRAQHTFIHAWDLERNRKLLTWRSEESFGPSGLDNAAISPDRKKLVVSLFHADRPEAPFELQIWETGQPSRILVRRTDFYEADTLEFAPDGSTLFIGGPYCPLLFLDPATGRVRRQLHGHQGSVLDVAVSPDGSRLASAGEDLTIRIWNLSTGRCTETLRGHEAPVRGVEWLDADTLVSISMDGTTRLWKAGARHTRRASPGYWTDFNGDLIYTPDSRHIIVTMHDGRLGEIDALTFEPTGRTWDAFHPLRIDAHTLHALTRDPLELVHCDVATGEIHHTGLRIPEDDRIVILNEADDPPIAVLGLGSGLVEFWDCAKGRRIARRDDHASTIFGAAIAPDASIACTGDTRGGVCIWDPRTGNLLHRITDNTSTVLCIAASNRGHVAVGRADGSLTVLDGASGTVITRVIAHSRGVSTLAYSPDGSRLFTGGYDGLISAWSVPDYREIVMLPLRLPDPSTPSPDPRPALLRFAPDASQLATFTEGGWLRRWELTDTTNNAPSDS